MIKISGRYFQEPLAVLFRTVIRAGKVSRRRTQAERLAGYIDYSLANDFREGFRPRQHQHDAHSLAVVKRQELEQEIVRERRAQEAEFLRAVISASDEFRRQAEARLAELDRDSGSVILLQRQREVREARERAEKVV